MSDTEWSGGLTPSRLTVDDTDELATLISYYHLYTDIAANCGDATTDAASNNSSNNQNRESSQPKNTKHNDEFWVEDQWTDRDYHSAKSLLEQSKDLCNVSSDPSRSTKLAKYTSSGAKIWDRFYGSHGTNFFQDRHYLANAFPNEFKSNSSQNEKVVAEIGCGVGNALLPLMQDSSIKEGWGFDYSKTAIDLLRQDPRFVSFGKRAHAHVWDITQPSGSWNEVNADVCVMLFCLSAIMPKDMSQAVKNVVSTVLRPGGTLLFRDYGRYDQAQLQLGTSRSKGLDDNLYVKHDGTRCYYFDLDDLERIFCQDASLQVLELKYLRRIYRNRADKQDRRRVWVQARFRKPVNQEN